MRRAWMVVPLIGLLLIGGCASDIVREGAGRIAVANAANDANLEALADLVRQQGALLDAVSEEKIGRGLQADSKAGGVTDEVMARFWTVLREDLARRAKREAALVEFIRTARMNTAEANRTAQAMVRAAESFGTKQEVAARLDSIESIIRTLAEKGSK